ncbi:hypothetical protein AN958_00471 [Leucoagaricus sp. SymC.cos]|nr:hypothetical protein AN958_00471 [Leucoagaricus sp. SymC.cos]
MDLVLVNAFIALQIAGTLGFLIISLTALFDSRVVRHPTWFSFCFSWVVWGISFSLLFFSGQQAHITSQPLCIAQSALVYTMPHLAGLTSVALVVYLFLNVRSSLISVSSTKRQPWSQLTSLALLLVPWFLGVVVFVSFLAYAIKHPGHVQLSHNGTYCVIVDSFLPKITAATGMAMSMTVLLLEGMCTRSSHPLELTSLKVVIGTILYKHRSSIDGFPQSVSLGIQLVIFTAVALCGVVLGLVFVITRTRGAPFDIMLGAIPVATSIIFGSQRDLVLSWMFWKPRMAMVHPSQQSGSSLGELSSIESIAIVVR